MIWLLALGLRLLTPQAIDVRIACFTNILDTPLTFTERENVFSTLHDLMYYKYVLQNVENAEVRILPDRFDCPNATEGSGEDSGSWYLLEDY
jgi:hypothetical protein